MFADIEADVYVLVDGDDTYDATAVSRLIEPVLYEQADMVNGVRIATVSAINAPTCCRATGRCRAVLSSRFRRCPRART
jgi:hypothetical protein